MYSPEIRDQKSEVSQRGVHAQERWSQKNPGYWKAYREKHQEYTRQNREKQRSRDHLLRTMAAISRQIAKMDAISVGADLLYEEIRLE